MSAVVSVYLEDEKGTILLLQIADGRFEGQWRPPGGVVDEGEEPREVVKEKAEEQLGVEIELFPYEERVRYEDTVSYIFKGRLVGADPEPGDGFAAIKRVGYDELRHEELTDYVEEDVRRLPGDFFELYPITRG